jgi:hypothetical protein
MTLALLQDWMGLKRKMNSFEQFWIYTVTHIHDKPTETTPQYTLTQFNHTENKPTNVTRFYNPKDNSVQTVIDLQITTWTTNRLEQRFRKRLLFVFIMSSIHSDTPSPFEVLLQNAF